MVAPVPQQNSNGNTATNEAFKNMGADMAVAIPGGVAGAAIGAAAANAIQNKSLKGVGGQVGGFLKDHMPSRGTFAPKNLMKRTASGIKDPLVMGALGWKAGEEIGSFIGRRAHIAHMQKQENSQVKQASLFDPE